MQKDTTHELMWHLYQKKELPDILGRTVIAPLRYSDALKISLIRGIEGEIFINGKKFELGPSNVFLIPPRYLHVAFYRKGGQKKGDMICNFNISLEKLSRFIDIKAILLSDNRSLFSFATRYDDFDRVLGLVEAIMDEERPFCARLADQLHLFEIFSAQSPDGAEAAEYNQSAIQIVDWIEEHYSENLSVQYAAECFGFSKYYFCKWFKTNTEMTFNEFLNVVRIDHACKYLRNGHSVEETSALCGYADSSYFIKVFKNFRGTTPHVYAAHYIKK